MPSVKPGLNATDQTAAESMVWLGLAWPSINDAGPAS